MNTFRPKEAFMAFQDHFSNQYYIYLKARPTYPDELFAYLASLTAGNDLCWDCATGSAQTLNTKLPLLKKVALPTIVPTL